MQAWNQQLVAAAHQAEAHAQHLIQQHVHLAAQQQQQQDAAAAASAGAAGGAHAPPVHLFSGLHRYLDALNAGLPGLPLALPAHSHPSRARSPARTLLICLPGRLSIRLDKPALPSSSVARCSWPAHGLRQTPLASRKRSGLAC